MLIKCQMLVWLRSLGIAAACFAVTSTAAHAEASATRLEHLHHATVSVAHAMSTAQLLGHAMAKRAIGRAEDQFLRELNICQNLGGINFGETRWRLQAVDAGSKLEELAHSERLFGIVLEAARQWNGTPEDAYNVLEALGVLNYQLEKLSVGLGHMSDEELATLRQRPSGIAPASGTSAAASATIGKNAADSAAARPRSNVTRSDDQNL